MATHVIVGSGAIGGRIASLLADRGESVRMVTRSGTGPEHDLIERVTGDASDARRLTELTAGADVLYNCANPKYTEWAQKWFPMNDAMIAAAKAAGAVYAITGNLYGYGRAAWVPGNPDLPHSFTYTGDMAQTLVALSRDERAWGKAWHVPTPEPITVRQAADRYSALVGAPRVTMHKLPRWVNHAAGRVNPMLREVAEMDYQFYFPFHLDSTLTQQTFGLTPTPIEVALRETAADAERIAARTM